MTYLLIFEKEQEPGLVEMIRAVAEKLGAEVKIRETVTVSTEDPRLVAALDALRQRAHL